MSHRFPMIHHVSRPASQMLSSTADRAAIVRR
jgi:hypothetical protein